MLRQTVRSERRQEHGRSVLNTSITGNVTLVWRLLMEAPLAVGFFPVGNQPPVVCGFTTRPPNVFSASKSALMSSSFLPYLYKNGASGESWSDVQQNVTLHVALVNVIGNYCRMPVNSTRNYFDFTPASYIKCVKRLRASALPVPRLCLRSAHTMARSSHIILHSFLLLSYPELKS